MHSYLGVGRSTQRTIRLMQQAFGSAPGGAGYVGKTVPMANTEIAHLSKKRRGHCGVGSLSTPPRELILQATQSMGDHGLGSTAKNYSLSYECCAFATLLFQAYANNSSFVSCKHLLLFGDPLKLVHKRTIGTTRVKPCLAPPSSGVKDRCPYLSHSRNTMVPRPSLAFSPISLPASGLHRADLGSRLHDAKAPPSGVKK